jgi:hypothetical protein
MARLTCACRPGESGEALKSCSQRLSSAQKMSTTLEASSYSATPPAPTADPCGERVSRSRVPVHAGGDRIGCRVSNDAIGRPAAAVSATDVIEPVLLPVGEAIGPAPESRTERQKNRHPLHSFAWSSWIVAKLSDGNCHYKPAGPKKSEADGTKLSFGNHGRRDLASPPSRGPNQASGPVALEHDHAERNVRRPKHALFARRVEDALFARSV